MTQREPRVSAGSLVDGDGGGHAPQCGMSLFLFPTVGMSPREPASPCTVLQALHQGPVPRPFQEEDVAAEPACLIHLGRGSALLTPDMQGLVQRWVLGRHARTLPRQRWDRQAWGQPAWAQSYPTHHFPAI